MDLKYIIYFLILLSGILTGAWYYRRLSFPSRILLFAILYIFIKESGAMVLSNLFKYNLSYYRYLGIVDFLVVALVFYLNFQQTWMRRTTAVLSLLLVLYFIRRSLVYDEASMDTEFRMLRGVALVLLSLIGYMQILQSLETQSLIRVPFFWFCTGVLIFYALSIFYWGFYKTFQETNNAVNYYRIVRTVFDWGNYLMYLMFLISLDRDGRRKE